MTLLVKEGEVMPLVSHVAQAAVDPLPSLLQYGVL